MYLKSLVLKGFKSFADRSVLTMEPGITAIVGPNGSGKSNISDAVLWVLGERNAKNLRGQVMEDVIFAGSSARKSVSVAEVTLVLDNSDGSLPVDFREVAVTRRMYRNGESDYLINNTLARRMDVLDILHDSGLGTGTHSIISQGHLDGILASRPEDRRALIEEAAGVLKHKQRKAKSQRKLEQMDQHLARVNDIVREVERQLGPLQRKARRAVQYEEASAQLREVQVALAVDDLRKLQVEWDAAKAHEAEVETTREKLKANVTSAEGEYERVQAKIRQESTDVAEKARRQTRASSVVDRLESTSRLISEKRRTAESRSVEVSAALEANAAKRALAQSQRDEAARRLEEVSEKNVTAEAALTKAQAALDEARKTRMVAEDELSRASRRRNETQRAIDQTRRDLAQAQEKLAGAVGRVQAAEGLDREFQSRVQDAEAALSASKEMLAEAQAQCELCKKEEETLRDKMTSTRAERDAARTELDRAADALRSLESQVKGLEEVERTTLAAASPARAWLLENQNDAVGSLSAFYEGIHVEQGYEHLVEAVLGRDTLALLVEDATRVRAIESALGQNAPSGDLDLLLSNDVRRQVGARAERSYPGRALSAKVQARGEIAALVQAVLGDVVICESLDEAMRMHADDEAGCRFVTHDGSMVWPHGKVTLTGKQAEQSEGSIERAGRIARLREEAQVAQSALSATQEKYDQLVQAARDAQDACLASSQRSADARGALSSAQREATLAEQRLSKARQEQAASGKSQQEARDIVDAMRPQVDALTLKLQQHESELSDYRDEVRAVQQRLDPARQNETQASNALSEAKLASATLAQQVAYERHVVDERARELIALSEQDERSLGVLTSKQAARKRTEPLLEVLMELTESAQAVSRKLTDEVEAAQMASMGAHSQAGAARDAYRQAQEAFNASSADLSHLREDRIRLEMRVQAAVDGIVHEHGMPLERALVLPPIEDRATYEDEALRLTRRIANMGTINPDAAQEYNELKTRYDYLKAQLADLAAARSTLRKIDAIIDERMKDDFANTFEEVNGHFQEIFAELFPGGTATLSLCDPDDIENTGVEVTAQPRGKRITKMSLMSGGEKSLVALTLLFAVYRTRSTPFYILDEVEAALDDSNLRRLIAYLEKLRHNTQLIMITHQRRTMEMADVLFGVSMQADGVTQVLSQRLEKALQYAE